jgi:hypothetical protein
MKLRKAVRFGILSLLMGAGTTYGLAWALANGPPRTDPRHWPGTILVTKNDGWLSRTESSFGVTCCVSLILEPDRHRVMVRGRKHPPTWSVINTKSPVELVGPTASGSNDCLLERRAGWPARATIERTYFPPLFPPGPAVPCSITGRDLTVRVILRSELTASLAFQPVWNGFVIDLVCYAVAWRALALAMQAVRSRLRARAGVCAVCRYDLTGSTTGVCPECGTAINPRPAA